MKGLKLAVGTGIACLSLGVLVPAVPATASAVSGLAGRWEYVGVQPGCRGGCFITPNGGYYAVDIVRLTIVDFPAGTLSGTWQEATCVRNGRWYQIADLSLPAHPDNGPAHDDFEISGNGSPSSFAIQGFAGGTRALPFGVSGYGLWYPDQLVYGPPVGGKAATGGQSYELPNENSLPRLFLLTGGEKAAIFYPASDYNPMGVCGVLPFPKRTPAKR